MVAKRLFIVATRLPTKPLSPYKENEMIDFRCKLVDWRTAVWLISAVVGILLAWTGTVLAQITPVTFDGFLGTGFTPGATEPDSLDSNLWRVTGMSDSPQTCDFGETCTSGDFARGANNGGTTTGGVYAFTNVGAPGNTILGVQPGGADFTPGTFTLRLQNTTGNTVDDIYVAYDIWYLNNQPRANSLNFSYAVGEGVPIDVPGFDFTTPLDATVSTPIEPEDWESVSRSETFVGVNWADGQFLYLIWTGDDVAGSVARDKYGIDNIEVRIGGPTAVQLTSLQTTTATIPAVAFVAVLLLLTGTAVALRRRPS
jgi:hypothetical protein